MLFSEQNNFAFVHIPKAAGTSVLKFLKSVLPDLECIGTHHNGVGDLETLKLIPQCPCGLNNPDRKEVPNITLRETVFLAILRNPLDVWISHYHWGVTRMGIYRETRYPGIWNQLYAAAGSSRRAYRSVVEFMEEGRGYSNPPNSYFTDHLGRPLIERLSLHGTFPDRLYLVEFNSVDRYLPQFVNEVLGVHLESGSLTHNNKVSYVKEEVVCPEFIRSREGAYFSGRFDPYLYQPKITE